MTASHPFDQSCLFCRIAAGQAPAKVRYESEHVIAFDDLHPKTPTHVLICPKGHYRTFLETPDEVLAQLNAEIKAVAAHLGFSEKGFRLLVNNGHESGQLIYHLHFHFLGGRTLGGF
jgi:histidine triad (HIT) family protein